jgi:hypothetical protein
MVSRYCAIRMMQLNHGHGPSPRADGMCGIPDAEHGIVAVAPLHAITAVYGEQELRARLAIEAVRLDGWASRQKAAEALQLADGCTLQTGDSANRISTITPTSGLCRPARRNRWWRPCRWRKGRYDPVQLIDTRLCEIWRGRRSWVVIHRVSG